jgi:phage-related protein
MRVIRGAGSEQVPSMSKKDVERVIRGFSDAVKFFNGIIPTIRDASDSVSERSRNEADRAARCVVNTAIESVYSRIRAVENWKEGIEKNMALIFENQANLRRDINIALGMRKVSTGRRNERD